MNLRHLLAGLLALVTAAAPVLAEKAPSKGVWLLNDLTKPQPYGKYLLVPDYWASHLSLYIGRHDRHGRLIVADCVDLDTGKSALCEVATETVVPNTQDGEWRDYRD